jgi:hypothetical protein
MGWREEGITLKLYISETGDFVTLGSRTDIPMTPGGSGIPEGFSLWEPNGAGSVNYTTSSLGRFSISNASTTDPQINKTFGAKVSFAMQPNKRYIMNVQAQVMDGKSTAKRYVVNGRTNAGTSWGVLQSAVSPWESIALYSDFATSPDTFTVYLGVNNANSATVNWGVQYQNLAIIALDQVPPAPTWHEVTCEVRSLQTRSGRERVESRYEVGTASIGVINDSGEFTYRPSHPWGLRPGRFVKVVAEVESILGPAQYPVYFGIIDGFTDSYTLDGHALQVIQCVDISSLLSNMTMPSMSNIETIQYSGTRFRQILNGVGWHPSQQSSHTGVFGQQGIVASGRTVRDELGLIADSEGSYFFADRTGLLVYRDRDWPTTDTNGSYVQADLLAQEEPEPVVHKAVKYVFPRVANNHMSTPHQAALIPPDDIEITAHISCASFANGGMIIGKAGAGSDYSWALSQVSNVSPFRQLNAYVGTNLVTTPGSVPFGSNQPFWIRVKYTRSPSVVSWYYANDAPTEPTAWTQMGSSASLGGLGQPASTNALTVGASYNGSNPFGGRIYEAIVRGTGGAIVYRISDRDTDVAGALSLTSSSGHPMTVNQTGTNVIVQDATTIEYLPVVDDIPTITDAPIVCTNELQTSWDRARVVNEVSLANQGGNAVTQVDAVSQSKYGPRTFQRMDLLNDNAHPEYISTRMADIMDGNTEAFLRVNRIRVRPTGYAQVRWALRAFLNDLVRTRYLNSREGWGYAVVSHIQGLEHSFGIDEWSLSLTLDDPQSFTYFESGSEGTGWDTGLWDEDIWDGAGDPSTPAYWDAGYEWSNLDTKWGA